MEYSEQINPADRNYNTISPSAKSLLVLKGYTNIPFARKAADLLNEQREEKHIFDFNKKDTMFWGRVVHFESRYWSIDQLLADTDITNILELSSGFSFRGLEMAKQKGIHYIDTDLPELIETKKKFVAAIQNDENIQLEGTLETLPLNALDRNQFMEIVNRFPPGKIAIVNEGLLMYLDQKEKEQVCSIIHDILKERGGYWITADIYIMGKLKSYSGKMEEKTKAFFEQHRIEENKFKSKENAKSFFEKMGLVIDREAERDHSKLSALKYLMKTITLWQMFRYRKAPGIQSTWRLKVDPEK
ncbi:MAG: hypothetical protein JWP12_3005 [Bacteroidetes bacterium]|nr:hypothetical protein [Bacteroidota bacterium]